LLKRVFDRNEYKDIIKSWKLKIKKLGSTFFNYLFYVAAPGTLAGDNLSCERPLWRPRERPLPGAGFVQQFRPKFTDKTQSGTDVMIF
jgi:hypothetical protein